jgi:FAS-associated factor 2
LQLKHAVHVFPKCRSPHYLTNDIQQDTRRNRTRQTNSNRNKSWYPIPIISSILTAVPARPPPKLTIWSLLCSPFTTIHRLLAFFTTLIPFLSRLSLKSIPTRRQLSPADTASRFIREFEELYGSRHIPFQGRGYADVTQHVKDADLYLLVVLISEQHDDASAFCKEVLCDEGLEEWIRTNDCVVWGGNIADSEAHTGTPP